MQESPTNDNALKRYWTRDPRGLAKWATKPHPYTSLVRELTEHVGLERAKRIAAQWFQGPRLMAEPIGDVLNGLGITATQSDGEFITDAVVLLKVVDAEGDVTLRMCHSQGMSWIERVGMLRTAEQTELEGLGDRGSRS